MDGRLIKAGDAYNVAAGIFDKLGWQECMTLMNETLARVIEIQKRSRERIAITGERGIPATIAKMGFGNPSNLSAQ